MRPIHVWRSEMSAGVRCANFFGDITTIWLNALNTCKLNKRELNCTLQNWAGFQVIRDTDTVPGTGIIYRTACKSLNDFIMLAKGMFRQPDDDSTFFIFVIATC
jgi:hypothetical protein